MYRELTNRLLFKKEEWTKEGIIEFFSNLRLEAGSGSLIQLDSTSAVSFMSWSDGESLYFMSCGDNGTRHWLSQGWVFQPPLEHEVLI